jgi:hypothetical protein
MTFIGIQNILPKSIQRAGMDGRITEAKIVGLFEEIKENFLPYGLGAKAQAMYLKNGVLAIASLSFEATQELTIKEDLMIEYINKEVGEKAVKRFRFIV